MLQGNGRCFYVMCNGKKVSNSTYYRHKKIRLARNNESIEILEQDFEPEVNNENDDFFANDNITNVDTENLPDDYRSSAETVQLAASEPRLFENSDNSNVTINSSDEESSSDEPEEQNYEHPRMNDAMPRDIFVKKIIEITTRYFNEWNGCNYLTY